MGNRRLVLIAAAAVMLGSVQAKAQETVKVGVNVERTGVGASYGLHISSGRKSP